MMNGTALDGDWLMISRTNAGLSSRSNYALFGLKASLLLALSVTPASSQQVVLEASGAGEYGPIAPRLNRAGYDVLAIDQRAGGDLFGGPNRTVEARGTEAEFCQAAPDLRSALVHALEERPARPIVLWGSSYSGALALRLAAQNLEGVAVVLAFSPASGGPMAECRGEAVSDHIAVPVLVLRPQGEMERESSVTQFELLAAQGHRTFVANPGTHGSSMLVQERVGAPVEDTWDVVLEFLSEVGR